MLNPPPFPPGSLIGQFCQRIEVCEGEGACRSDANLAHFKGDPCVLIPTIESKNAKALNYFRPKGGLWLLIHSTWRHEPKNTVAHAWGPLLELPPELINAAARSPFDEVWFYYDTKWQTVRLKPPQEEILHEGQLVWKLGQGSPSAAVEE